MDFEYTKDPISHKWIIRLTFDHGEIYEAFMRLSPFYQEIIKNYLNDDSSVSDKIFGLSELIREIEGDYDTDD